MNLWKKLALAGVGLVFVLGLSVNESFGQYRTRSANGYRTYSRGYSQYQSPYSYRRYNRYNRHNRLSWRERRRLVIQRHRMLRAQRRYYRTRARILNRGAGRTYYPRQRTYYRNW